MNSIAKTFGAMALSSLVAAGGTAFYYEHKNDTREANELEEANSINPNFVKSWNQLGVYHQHYSCFKDVRQGVLSYEPDLIEIEHNGSTLKKPADSDQKPRVILTDSLSIIYEGEISFDQTAAAINTLEKFCHTGEFNNPAPE